MLLIVRHTPVSTLLSCCLVSLCVRTSCPCSRVARASFKDSANCLVYSLFFLFFMPASRASVISEIKTYGYR